MAKVKMSNQQLVHCNSIIHGASAAAGAAGAGLAQVPLSDAAIITCLLGYCCYISHIKSIVGQIFGEFWGDR